MNDKTAAPSIEELEAAATRAQAALDAARAEAAVPTLTVGEARDAVAAAEAALQAAEGTKWELTHATIALNQARRDAEQAPEFAREAFTAQIGPAEARLKAAQAAYDAAPPDGRTIDLAAQAVLDARAALAKAEGA